MFVSGLWSVGTPQKRGLLRKLAYIIKKMDFFFTILVGFISTSTLWFIFSVVWKQLEFDVEKIHLFYHVLNIASLSGLPTITQAMVFAILVDIHNSISLVSQEWGKTVLICHLSLISRIPSARRGCNWHSTFLSWVPYKSRWAHFNKHCMQGSSM